MARLLRQPGLSLVIYGERFMAANTARPEDVARVAAAFGADGPALASIFSKGERSMIAASFRQQAAKLDGTPRRDIERAAEAFTSTPCGRPCETPP